MLALVLGIALGGACENFCGWTGQVHADWEQVLETSVSKKGMC
jgi:hypothetical protein